MRRVRTYQSRVRDRRNTRRVPGIHDDDGVYYRCHWCGWVLDREQRGDAFGDIGAKKGNFTVVAGATGVAMTSVPYNNDSMLSMGEGLVLPRIDAAGDRVTIINQRVPRFAGCPLCGTRSNRT